ncbi:hypothetical protein E0Z10_g1079 [Xylaria hypoxylon]|uniref:J domain-containing protein n=1 Tax=Xylaria hypoxylon TaxID=37992 RepID=A0A4Z0Z858_9PEZI|nr:hypothetical protein E0Z10_g1079 [Xylaria hypoxylon]
MTTEISSPKRRHILSSINPEKRSISPVIEETGPSREAPPAQEPRDNDEEQRTESTLEGTARKTSKFRFKTKHSRPHRSSRDGDRDRDRERSPYPDGERDHDGESTSSRRHHSHSHRHRHHRHKRRRARSRSPTPQNPYGPPPLDTEAAFRESLFDAMADDEGAAYWEGVYGQPIHVYSQERVGPEGELERMGDDEYAAHVRQKMWEKTHQGLLEERARREERRKQKEHNAEEAARLTKEMESSLRRGEERRAKKGWKQLWDVYTKTWETWDGTLQGMAWPVRSGRREDIEASTVREFYVMAIDPVEVGEKGFLAKLKDERVRWHPDKIQQRLGGRVDEAVMRDVTAVFQIVDKLWTDTRSKQAARAQ